MKEDIKPDIAIIKEKTKFLWQELRFLGKIGPKTEQNLQKLLGNNRICDLLYHFPSSITQKSYLPRIYEILDKEIVILKLRVDQIIDPPNNRAPTKIKCSNASGFVTLIFFKTFPGYIEKNFKIGSEIAVSGRADRFAGDLQIAHPEYVLPANLIDQIPRSEVNYPLIAGLNQKLLRNKIAEILEKIPELPEWIDLKLLEKNSWVSWKNALINIHHKIDESSRRRLAYDELLASQIANQISRQNFIQNNGIKTIGTKELQKKLIASLPFELTAAQQKVLQEIYADMEGDKKMLRLLQGDVGSGKTIVAFLAALKAIEEKKQVALVVPISLLAEQHYNNLIKLTKDLDIKIAVLTSKTTKKQKEKILKELKNGEIDIIIGTHALIYPEIIFKNLALIIIDEQHRFGVLQRLELTKKAIAPDLLLMSATPIPRSLMMTLYGDMEISIINQKPKNRAPIDTRAISVAKIEEIYDAIARALKKGEKIYWICPLIEETVENPEEAPIANVLERYEIFKKKFGENKVALIHGQMNGKEKDAVMEKFSTKNAKSAKSEVQILVATTVIEVGIDVSDATIMIIENCEKFGLSQLHQLRGRVGRSDKKSYNILLYGKNIGQAGKARLQIMKESNDGFRIAEEDMKMRGFGQILGTKQSGFPEYKIANLALDANLLTIANAQAKYLLNNDANLTSKSGIAARILLKIFNYDNCLKLVRGG